MDQAGATESEIRAAFLFCERCWAGSWSPESFLSFFYPPHPPSSALNQDIRGQWLHRLLNTYHFKDRGSLWLRFFRSVIHTWTTQSHNWSTRPVKFFNIHICYNSRVKIREFVNWSVRLYFGLHPLQNYLFNELGWNAESKVFVAVWSPLLRSAAQRNTWEDCWFFDIFLTAVEHI